MSIVRLDNKTIERIAAGEVIESPVSIIKELVENSIDAKANNIVVEIKNGGKSYIRVTDDGIGIDKDEMELAFEKHTTSKISKFEDLYDIYSLGFRGEALASIVTVSDVVAISKTKDSDVGQKVTFNSGVSKKAPIATNTGTSIEVYDLFKNIPVRFKFLKSDISETNSISKLMYSLALGNPCVSFKYIKDGRIEFKTNNSEDLFNRIVNILDENLKDNLIKIKNKNQIYKLEGYVTSSNYYRASRSMQYLYVNNRLVDSNLITTIIEREYRSYIPSGRFPALFLFIETNPKNLDVNVHPNKKTIKFNYEDELIELIENAVSKELSSNSSPKDIEVPVEKTNDLLDLSEYSKLLNSYKNYDNVKENSPSYEESNFFDSSIEIESQNKIDKDININNDIKNNDYQNKQIEAIETKKTYYYKYIGSIFGKYSIFSSDSDTIFILDHRRADEAIKYYEYINQVEKDKVSSQVLLEPIIINLRANDKDNFAKKSSKINQLGFDLEEFGQDQVIIRSIPIIFEEPELETLFYELLDIEFDSKEDIFFKKLHKIIKSNSFRKGHNINENEANELLDKLFKLDNPYKTYDGKSTIIKVNKKDLEKYFDR